jgi:cytidylate kinase
MPNADLKIFFKCSIEVKTKRRLKDFRKSNKTVSLVEVKKALKQRDFSDKNRKESPLLFTKGAVLVDTTNLNLNQMKTKLKKLVEGAIKTKKYGSL